MGTGGETVRGVKRIEINVFNLLGERLGRKYVTAPPRKRFHSDDPDILLAALQDLEDSFPGVEWRYVDIGKGRYNFIPVTPTVPSSPMPMFTKEMQEAISKMDEFVDKESGAVMTEQDVYPPMSPESERLLRELKG